MLYRKIKCSNILILLLKGVGSILYFLFRWYFILSESVCIPTLPGCYYLSLFCMGSSLASTLIWASFYYFIFSFCSFSNFSSCVSNTYGCQLGIAYSMWSSFYISRFSLYSFPDRHFSLLTSFSASQPLAYLNSSTFDVVWNCWYEHGLCVFCSVFSSILPSPNHLLIFWRKLRYLRFLSRNSPFLAYICAWFARTCLIGVYIIWSGDSWQFILWIGAWIYGEFQNL